MPQPLAKALRVGAYTLVAFVVGSLVLGAIEGNPFDTNLEYGLRTGVPAAIILGAIMGVINGRANRRR